MNFSKSSSFSGRELEGVVRKGTTLSVNANGFFGFQVFLDSFSLEVVSDQLWSIFEAFDLVIAYKP